MGTLKESPPDQLRGAAEMIDDRLRIERLVRANARRAMVIDIIERLVEDPGREDFAPSDMEYWSPLHDALREKLRAALAEPDQLRDATKVIGKPVAWRKRGGALTDDPYRAACWRDDEDADVTQLYAAPPRREWRGLTDEEIARILGRGNVAERTDRGAWVVLPYGLARAIEAALKEKNT